MRKLKDNESIALKTAHWPGKNQHVKREVKELRIGERLLVSRDDWKTKSEPNGSTFKSRTSSNQYTVRQLADNSGWVISRVA